MILADHQIREGYLAQDFKIEPFDESQIQPASYDFRVGTEAVTTSSEGIIDLSTKRYVVLKPGDFGIFISHEIITLGPKIVGRFGLPSGLSRKGLIATTGPQIDPGYHGRLIVGITNLTPKDVSISHLEKFLTIEFHELDKPVLRPYAGRYQNRLKITEEEIGIIADKSGIPLVRVMESMEELKQDVHGVKKDIDNLGRSNSAIRWMIAVGLTLVGLVVGIGAAVINITIESSRSQPMSQQPQSSSQPPTQP